MRGRLTTRGLNQAFTLLAVIVLGLTIGMAIPALSMVSTQFALVASMFMATIMAGEIWRVSILDSRDLAPLALAASLAFAMTDELPGQDPSGWQAGVIVLCTALASTLGGGLRQAITGNRMNWSVVANRIIVTAVAVFLFRVAEFGDLTLLEWAESGSVQRWFVAMVMWGVAATAMCVHIAAASVQRAARTHARIWQSTVDEAAAIGPVAIAVTSTAAVIPLAMGPLGPVAIPLFLIPLGLLRLAVARQSSVRTAQRQTIFALSRLTEQGGFTPVGHATRVARLSVAMGRELGVAERDLVDLEYAALLHDLGQVSLRRPIPGGATVQTAPLDQKRIANAGASILARTAELSRLSPVVADQATPFARAQETGLNPLNSRILKVANAFDDLVGLIGGGDATSRALSRIRLGVGHEYDPSVVRALCQVLVREGRLSPAELASIDF